MLKNISFKLKNIKQEEESANLTTESGVFQCCALKKILKKTLFESQVRHVYPFLGRV